MIDTAFRRQIRPKRRKVLCAGCGSANVSTSVEKDRFVYGLGDEAVELEVDVPVRTCLECGTQFTDDEAEALRHDAVCRHLGVLTPRQIRTIRAQYGLSRSEFAQATSLGEATIARWESGASIQNAAYDRFLRLLMHRENFARLRAVALPNTARANVSRVIPFPPPRLRMLREVPAALLVRQESFQLQR